MYVPKDLLVLTVPKSSVPKIAEMENVTSPLVNATILFVPLDLKARPALAKLVVVSALMVLGIARPENALVMKASEGTSVPRRLAHPIAVAMECARTTESASVTVHMLDLTVHAWRHRAFVSTVQATIVTEHAFAMKVSMEIYVNVLTVRTTALDTELATATENVLAMKTGWELRTALLKHL